MASRLYDFTIAAAVGATQQVHAMGRRITLMAATQDAIDVRVPELGVSLKMAPGQTYTAPDGKSFREVVLANRVASACLGELFIGDGSLTDNAVSGTVGVKSLESDRTLSDTAFMAAVVHTSAANKPAAQIVNKVGTIRRAVITRVQASSGTAGMVYLGRYSGTLASLHSRQPASKFVQSAGWVADSELETRHDELAAELGTTVGAVYLPANGGAVFELPQPVILAPGQSLLLMHSVSGAVPIAATFDGYML